MYHKMVKILKPKSIKESLEQLGWKITYEEKYKVYDFYYPKSGATIVYRFKGKLSLLYGWVNVNELQLILDYIKELENENIQS